MFFNWRLMAKITSNIAPVAKSLTEEQKNNPTPMIAGSMMIKGKTYEVYPITVHWTDSKLFARRLLGVVLTIVSIGFLLLTDWVKDLFNKVKKIHVHAVLIEGENKTSDKVNLIGQKEISKNPHPTAEPNQIEKTEIENLKEVEIEQKEEDVQAFYYSDLPFDIKMLVHEWLDISDLGNVAKLSKTDHAEVLKTFQRSHRLEQLMEVLQKSYNNKIDFFHPNPEEALNNELEKMTLNPSLLISLVCFLAEKIIGEKNLFTPLSKQDNALYKVNEPLIEKMMYKLAKMQFFEVENFIQMPVRERDRLLRAALLFDVRIKILGPLIKAFASLETKIDFINAIETEKDRHYVLQNDWIEDIRNHLDLLPPSDERERGYKKLILNLMLKHLIPIRSEFVKCFNLIEEKLPDFPLNDFISICKEINQHKAMHYYMAWQVFQVCKQQPKEKLREEVFKIISQVPDLYTSDFNEMCYDLILTDKHSVELLPLFVFALQVIPRNQIRYKRFPTFMYDLMFHIEKHPQRLELLACALREWFTSCKNMVFSTEFMWPINGYYVRDVETLEVIIHSIKTLQEPLKTLYLRLLISYENELRPSRLLSMTEEAIEEAFKRCQIELPKEKVYSLDLALFSPSYNSFIDAVNNINTQDDLKKILKETSELPDQQQRNMRLATLAYPVYYASKLRREEAFKANNLKMEDYPLLSDAEFLLLQDKERCLLNYIMDEKSIWLEDGIGTVLNFNQPPRLLRALAHPQPLIDYGLSLEDRKAVFQACNINFEKISEIEFRDFIKAEKKAFSLKQPF